LQPSAVVAQPSAFVFSTGVPDGKVATISEPSSARTSNVEYESADDFALTTQTQIQQASFTGLLTGGATAKDVSNVNVEIYRVFPNDSNVGRTSGPPTFSTDKVPTRVNSPSDVQFDSRDSLNQGLTFQTRLLSPSFTAQNSVSSADKIGVKSGGNGPVTGQEVAFGVTFTEPFDLPAGHYFFVPQVGLSDQAPAGADFLWLSAPKPIVPPGTPFPSGVPDLQSWMRDDPPLAPDWLRIGTDIIGGTTFNATFSLLGNTVTPTTTGLSQTSAAEGSTNLPAVPANGRQPLATTFVNSGQLQAILPAALRAEEGHLELPALGGENGLSNTTNFTIPDSASALTAPASQGLIFQDNTPNGLVTDQGVGGHRVATRQEDVLGLGTGTGGSFSATHTFAAPGHLRHDSIPVTAPGDEVLASAAQAVDVSV
jgi:hypothetical protein